MEGDHVEIRGCSGRGEVEGLERRALLTRDDGDQRERSIRAGGREDRVSGRA